MFSTFRSIILCLIVLSLVSPEAMAADDYFQVTNLAPDLMMLSTDQGSYSNNSLVFKGEDGVLLVDTHHDQDRDEFRKFVENLGLGSPRYIITTHRHVEHIGCNDIFGPDPTIISHQLMPGKLLQGSFVFSEYHQDAFPDITFADSLEIKFNGEVIRLVNIGGSHDDNEIMVHFTKHAVAHVSSVVNGFNFPSVDSDGDVMQFEAKTRFLMSLLPKDISIVSGHHGKATGYDFVGSWDQLPAYADMMKETVAIVKRELAEGKTQEEMQEAGVFDKFEHYAGSYVSTDDWIAYVVDALTVPRETREDPFLPVFKVWQTEGATAAMEHYRDLAKTREEQYAVNEYVPLSIGSKLFHREMYEDAIVFFRGFTDLYPDADYVYYGHYLAARGYQKLNQMEKAEAACRLSLEHNSDFESASDLLKTLSDDVSGG